MQSGIVSIRNRSKAENILVYYLVFEIFWSFFTNFSFWFGGAFINILGKRFTFFSQILLWITFFVVSSKSPSVAPKGNMSYGIAYVLILLLTWLLTLFNCGVAANSLIVWAFNGFIIISIRDDLKLRCFELFAKWLAIILVPAIIEYVVFELTGFGIVTGRNIQRGTYDVYLDQLMFNFINTNYPIQRFQFLTEEPGLLGTCCAFMLFALRGNSRYTIHSIIYIIAGLLTFSLAYYLLLVIYIATSGIRIKYLFLFIIIGATFYYFFQETFDMMLYTRVEAKEGADAILSRNSYELDIAVEKAWKNGDLWLGHALQVGEGNAGYKVWFWQYGVLSIIFLFFFYWSYFRNKIREHKAEKVPCLLFFVIFWVSFYQRQNITFLDYMVIILTIPVIFGAEYINNTKALLSTNSQKKKIIHAQ